MDKKVSELLNDQINKEFYSAYLYLDMANFYASKGESVIYINPGDVVTSVAREEAEKKGILFCFFFFYKTQNYILIFLSSFRFLRKMC